MASAFWSRWGAPRTLVLSARRRAQQQPWLKRHRRPRHQRQRDRRHLPAAALCAESIFVAAPRARAAWSSIFPTRIPMSIFGNRETALSSISKTRRCPTRSSGASTYRTSRRRWHRSPLASRETTRAWSSNRAACGNTTHTRATRVSCWRYVRYAKIRHACFKARGRVIKASVCH